jgi:hypothetical protein
MHSVLHHRRRPWLHGRAAAALICTLATTRGCSDRSIAKYASESSGASGSSEEGSSTSSTDGASETTIGANDAVACHDEPLQPGDGVDYSPCHTAESFPCSSCDEWCAAVGRECAYTAVIMGECPAYVPGPPQHHLRDTELRVVPVCLPGWRAPAHPLQHADPRSRGGLVALGLLRGGGLLRSLVRRAGPRGVPPRAAARRRGLRRAVAGCGAMRRCRGRPGPEAVRL